MRQRRRPDRNQPHHAAQDGGIDAQPVAKPRFHSPRRGARRSRAAARLSRATLEFGRWKRQGRAIMAVAAAKRAVDPKRYFESVDDGERTARARAGLPLSGDDQPLQSALHDLPAHLRGARAAGRHELGPVHVDRRSDPAAASRRAARRRRADAGEESAAHGALSQRPRHLCAVQHQRHGAQREERPRADRKPSSTSCASRSTPPTPNPTAPFAARTISTAS